MTTELERTKKALAAAMLALAELEGADNRAFTAQRCQQAFKEINSIRNPVEYEPVEETVGWVNVYQLPNGALQRGIAYDTEEQCFAHTNPPFGSKLLSCQPIRVTVKREKKRPVERSVTIDANIDPYGTPWSEATRDTCLYRDIPELHGKRVILTATYTEDPTT